MNFRKNFRTVYTWTSANDGNQRTGIVYHVTADEARSHARARFSPTSTWKIEQRVGDGWGLVEVGRNVLWGDIAD